MKRTAAAGFLFALFLNGCAVDIAGAPCLSNDNCPSGQYCGSDGTCLRGSGVDGQDAGWGDGGLDAGHPSDASAGDAGPRDASADSGLDAGKDAGRDGGFDGGGDGGPVIGCDETNPCEIGVCCEGRCWGGECCESADCTVPGKPFCTEEHKCADKCPGGLSCGTGYICCEEQCYQGDCCTAADCQNSPTGKICVNYHCSKACVSEADCQPGHCCLEGAGKGACYSGECCSDKQCTAPKKCGGGGASFQCGCTPETNTAFCGRLDKKCGEAKAPDNCGVLRTVNCGTCGGCTYQCTSSGCAANSQESYKCDGGDVYWYDSCGARQEFKDDCVFPEVCYKDSCCTPSVKNTACSGKCGEIDDGCGGVHDCGACSGGFSCDTVSNKCYCPSGTTCGSGALAQCCTSGQVCDGGAKCCTQETNGHMCLRLGKCGWFTGTDNCGKTRSIDCGGCDNDFDCQGNECVCPSTVVCMDQCCSQRWHVCHAQAGTCCAPVSQADACSGKDCGEVPDGCGGSYACGQDCSNGYQCNENVCVCLTRLCGPICCPNADDVCDASSGACCAPITDLEWCNDKSYDCGTWTAVDNCGVSRSIQCGGCSGPGKMCCMAGGNAGYCLEVSEPCL